MPAAPVQITQTAVSLEPPTGKVFCRAMTLAGAMKTVVAITGASGIIYGIRLLENLPGHRTVIVSDDAEMIAKAELGVGKDEIHKLAEVHYENSEMYAPISSGSVGFYSMAIVPCSTSTM